MKTHKMRQLGVSLGVIGVMVPIVMSMSFAQNGAKSCKEEAKENFSDFMGGLVEFDSSNAGWEDIFERNTCQQADAASVTKRMEQLKKTIEKTLNACNFEQAEKFQHDYYKLEMELDYIRGLVLTDSSNPKSTTNTINPGIQQELKTKFVNNKEYLTGSEFNEYFKELEKRYASRKTQDKGSYLNCSDSSSEDLEKAVESLKDTLESFVNTLAATGKAEANTFTSAAERAKSKLGNAAATLETAPSGSQFGTSSKRTEAKETELGAKRDLETLYEIKLKETPLADSVSQSDLLGAYASEDTRYSFALDQATFEGRYEYLFQDNADALRDALVEKLKNTNKTIKSTYAPLSKLTKCVQTINNRQCKSSE